MHAPTSLLSRSAPIWLSALALAGLRPATAATSVVDSVATLQSALSTAQPGDVVTVKAGAYVTRGALRVTCAGTKERPIVIAAETVGAVEIAGAGGFNVAAPAAYVEIRGFRFTHAAGHEVIGGGTNHVRFSRNTFLCSGEGAYLTVSGDDAEVDHNELADKSTLGNMISVTGTGTGKQAQVARRLWIHHNYFHDFKNAHGNGAETIRFGLSGYSMSTGAGLVEYNLFVRCTGENELISNKSCGNTYRYNTFLDSPGAQLTIRHGNDCVVYGNYFRHLDGLRIFGDRHLIFSNYFEGNTRGINIGNGDGEVADGAKLTSHDRPDYTVIVYNTLVNNQRQYELSERNGGMGATHTTFANNLIVGGDVAVQIDGKYTDPVWANNIMWQVNEDGTLPPSGFTNVDPQLAPDAKGTYRPQKGSPAIGAGTGDYPKVTVDMDGQPRPEKKSIGADEPSDAPVIAHLLTPAEVGPAAK